MFKKQKQKFSWDKETEEISGKKNSDFVNIRFKKSHAKIIALGLFCAIVVVLVSYAFVFREGSVLSGDTVFERRKIVNVSDEVLYNSEPVDYENGVLVDYYACQADDDCIIVGNDQCDCTSGGYNTAINKKYRERWSARIYPPAFYKICQTALNPHPSCAKDVIAECINSECRQVKKN